MNRIRPLLPAAYQPVLRETVDSTNNAAKQLAREGAAAGMVVWAMQQTAGRGRRGRSWVSPPGNLYASLLLRPSCPPEEAAQLGFVTALAVADALEEMAPGLPPIACKWPNDVLVGGRKIAGILLESEIGADQNLAFLIIGLGVNLVFAPADAEFPATSLSRARGFRPPHPMRRSASFSVTLTAGPDSGRNWALARCARRGANVLSPWASKSAPVLKP